MKMRTTDTEVAVLKVALQIGGKFVKFHQQKYDNSLYCDSCHDLEPSLQYLSGMPVLQMDISSSYMNLGVLS